MNQNTIALKISLKSIQKLTAGLLCMVCVLAVIYAYFVTTTILNVVQYRTVTEEITDVSASIGLLESNYLVLSKSMTIERAYRLGLVDVLAPTYLALETAPRTSALALEIF